MTSPLRKPEPLPMSFVATTIIGVGMFVSAALLLCLLISMWPEPSTVDRELVPWPGRTNILFVGNREINPEIHAILLVVIAAALGSFIHAGTSFATYVGNREAASSWIWWYILRLPIGMTLGLVFYFALRAGLLANNAGVNAVSPFGIAALAALAGMFSKQAADKLGEVFTTAFRTAKAERERADKLKGESETTLRADCPDDEHSAQVF